MILAELFEVLGSCEDQFRDFNEWEVCMEIEPFAKVRCIYHNGAEVRKLTDAISIIVDHENKLIGICCEKGVS